MKGELFHLGWNWKSQYFKFNNIYGLCENTKNINIQLITWNMLTSNIVDILEFTMLN